MTGCVLETDRLLLRRMTQEDYGDLCEILQDPVAMTAYEHAFSDAEVQEWLDRQLGRYEQHGFGLWAAVRKDTGEMIGQIGITMQDYNGRQVPEIGYLFKRKYWHNGYATEGAIACKSFAFDVLGFSEIYSIIRDNNFASQRVAQRNGMVKSGEFVKHYYQIDMPHFVYQAKKEDH